MLHETGKKCVKTYLLLAATAEKNGAGVGTRGSIGDKAAVTADDEA